MRPKEFSQDRWMTGRERIRQRCNESKWCVKLQMKIVRLPSKNARIWW